MSTIDLVFEGGGAKGMVFIGALEVRFEGATHTHGRLLGTSAGAITALALAARFTIPELNAALTEKDEQDTPIFMSFLGNPPPFDADAIRHSAIRRLLTDLNIPFMPDFAENRWTIGSSIIWRITPGPPSLLVHRARRLVFRRSFVEWAERS